MRTFGRDGQDDRALAGADPRTDHGLRQRCGALRCPKSLWDDVDSSGRDAEQPLEVIARAGGGHDDPLRAARRERDEHPHPQPADAKVRLGNEAEVEIVDRHDAREPAPRGAGVGEAVDDVDAGVGREPGQQQLLAAHPLEAVSCPHTDSDRRHQLGPRAPSSLRLAVDERSEAHTWCRRDERRDEFPGVGFRASGRAGDEEHQVETDVHRRRQ